MELDKVAICHYYYQPTIYFPTIMSPEFNRKLATQITITPAAAQQFGNLVAQESDVIGVRIFVGGGGCSGMKYGMTFADKSSQYDSILHLANLDVYIDAVALGFLTGVEIDFVTEGANKNFVFKNAFAATGGASTCGSCSGAG